MMEQQMDLFGNEDLRPKPKRTGSSSQSIVFHDIGMNRKVCSKSGHPIAPMDFISVNDCEEYKSPYLSDYRRRTDLENELKKQKEL